MPITLAEAKVGMANKVDQQVVDLYRRESMLLDLLTFDNAVSPGTGGSTLVYGYQQLKTPATAKVRQINSEYTAGEAKREEKTAKVVILGGKFQIDRVLAETDGAIDEIAFQTEEKVKATRNEFHNLVINGTSATTGTGFVVNTFDGLKKMITGTSNEITATVDLSTAALRDSNYQAFLDELDGALSLLDGSATALMMGTQMLTVMRGIARRAGYYSNDRNEFGKQVEAYNGIPMIDMGKYYNGSASVDVIPTDTTKGTTAIYAVETSLNGFHGISPTGTKVIKYYAPDLTAPGAVKDGEVELIAGVVLKNTNKAVMLKDIKIKAASV